MKSDRKNITQPTDWWSAFNAAAEAEGVSLAEWMGACGVANLPKDVAAKLSERGTRGKPPSEDAKSH